MHTPVAVTALGDKYAVLAMTREPFVGYVGVASDPASPPTLKPLTKADWGAQPNAWTFPADLLWVDDGSSDGLLLATCYSGQGILVTASTDAGQTWTPRSNPIAALFAAGLGPSEPQLAKLPDGRLLLLTRWDTRSERGAHWGNIWAQWSSDDGATWTTARSVIHNMSGQPAVAVMPDGALLVALRDPRRDGSMQSLVIGESRDGGATWKLSDVDLGVMMYADIVPLSDSTALLIAATEKSRTDSDVWTRRLERSASDSGQLQDIADRWDTLGDVAAETFTQDRILL